MVLWSPGQKSPRKSGGLLKQKALCLVRTSKHASLTYDQYHIELANVMALFDFLTASALPHRVTIRTPSPFPERTIRVKSHNINYPDVSELECLAEAVSFTWGGGGGGAGGRRRAV